MSDLPEDLVEEILCRVPATSLRKLRSTCKRWKSLFYKRRFTRKHIDKAAKQFLVLMLKEFRVCLMSANLHGNQSVEVTGELSLIDPRKQSRVCLDQFEISNISNCDGLLLCSNGDYTRLVVWNPCTGQTKWNPPRKRRKRSNSYALGSYQDNKSGDKSYKIMCYYYCNSFSNKFDIYEINSNIWRTLDVTAGHILCEF